MDRSKWEYKKLGEVATFERGLTYSKGDEATISSNGVLRSNNIDLDTHELVFDEIKYLSPNFVIPESKKLKKDSIFICMSNGSKAHLGKVAFADKDYDYAFGGFMGMIVPQNIFPKYLFYYFLSHNYRNGLEQIGKGANINNLRFAQLAEFKVPTPPMEDQQRIVAELDCLNEMIAVKQEQLKEFDKLAQSIFYDMFGDPLHDSKWDKVVLGNVCKTTSGGTPSKNNSSYYDGGNIGWLRSGDITTHIWENKAFITKEGMDNSSAKMFPVNTVVVAMYGATVGQVGILHIETTTNQAVCGIFPNNSFNPVYLCYHFMCVKPLLIKSAIGGAQPNISQCLIKSLRVPLPPLALQQQFAEKIQAIEAQKELVKQSIAETQSLLDYTMDKYFGYD